MSFLLLTSTIENNFSLFSFLFHFSVLFFSYSQTCIRVALSLSHYLTRAVHCIPLLHLCWGVWLGGGGGGGGLPPGGGLLVGSSV